MQLPEREAVPECFDGTLALGPSSAFLACFTLCSGQGKGRALFLSSLALLLSGLPSRGRWGLQNPASLLP